jgi:uncharacterized membrane-anchored protein
MDCRAAAPEAAQQTVEGLSAAAIAYYVIGLLTYLMKPLNSIWPTQTE